MTPTERTEYYLEKLFWPLIGAIVLVCASYYNIYQVFIIAGVYCVLAGSIARYTILIQEHWKVGAIVGLLSGSLLGIIQSIFVLVIHFSVPAIFSLLPRTLITITSVAVTAALFIECYYIGLRLWARYTIKPSKNIAHTPKETTSNKKQSTTKRSS